MKQTLIPPRLQHGDIIGVVSPSSPPRDETHILHGIAALSAEGHYLRIGRSVGARDGYLAGSDALRAGDLLDMFTDERVRAIFATRGGYGAARLLGQLDYAVIRRHPKILVGFSDITALSLGLFAKTRLVTFAGPMVAAEFASGMLPVTADALWRILRRRLGRQKLPHCEQTHIMSPGSAEGTLLGGNLAVLCSLVGTPWLPDFRGAVLFLEDVGESVYRIDRMLLQLREAGILRGLAGVLLGGFTAIPEDQPDRELPEVLNEYLLPLEIPVLTGIPFGHFPEKITLPLGSRVRIDTQKRSVTVLQAVVS